MPAAGAPISYSTVGALAAVPAGSLTTTVCAVTNSWMSWQASSRP
jgi:hypothetical protein